MFISADENPELAILHFQMELVMRKVFSGHRSTHMWQSNLGPMAVADMTNVHIKNCINLLIDRIGDISSDDAEKDAGVSKFDLF